ncbi:4-alpha-glucanotransferase [Sphingomonas sp. Tas61C01]|uniref:4-alpha-glucanotransferase n=1 Tax=Sphingomonas sp. Tas61C01 TaxID=3458297 RepID=UPI00403EC489
MTSGLDALVAAAGLSAEWEDADGVARTVERSSLLAILAALGLPANDERQVAESLARLGDRPRGLLYASGDVGRPVALPAGVPAGAAALAFEDGRRAAVTLAARDGAVMLPPVAKPGYHRLETMVGMIELTIAPERCWQPPAGRHWGAAVQIPALQGRAATPFGDLATLAEAAATFGRHGAAALAINPVHALFPADASRFSPYAPATRLFRNVMLAQAASESASGPLIDWASAIPARLAGLRRAFGAIGDDERATLTTFRQEGGAALERQALFDALHGYFFVTIGAPGWREWPAAFHDPDGDAAIAFAAKHPNEIDFFAYLQMVADHGLAAAQAAARGAGMAIGLVADLAVGVDPGGSQAWSGRGDLLAGLSIGAPPDPLGPSGQNWGITALSPVALRRTGFAAFKATLRASMAHAGGLRIDHALGLSRLWVVPEGAPAGEGAYLAMPFEELLRIVAIESLRAQTIVIGEDLGTVPPGFRDVIAARGILGLAVLPFERDEATFKPAVAWSRQAVAMTGTHDTPTIAGWWQGRDLEWRSRIEHWAPPALAEAQVSRAQERSAMWQAIGDGVPPADPAIAVDAAIDFAASTRCPLVIVPLEDLLGLDEQPNLPGTIDEHPNWRRRMPGDTAALLESPPVAARIARLNRIKTA